MAYGLAGMAALAFTGARLHAPDEFEYLAIGQNLDRLGLFSLDGTTPTAWRSPGLPFLLAALWAVWPSVTVLKAAGLAAWGATGWLVGRLATTLYGERAGQLSAAFYLCYLYELYAATTLYPQTLAGLFVTASVWIIVRPRPLGRRDQAFLLAATILEICLVPNCALVPAVLYSCGLLKRKLRFWQAAVAAVLTLSIVLGWCIRNDRAMGVFGFTTSLGVTLYDGNRDHITAATAGSPDALDLPEGGRGISETALDRIYRARAVAWIRAHTWQAAKLLAAKFFYFFAATNTLEARRPLPFMGPLTAAMAVLYYSVVAGALAACLSRTQAVREAAWLSWTMYLGIALSYAVFLTRIRYRLPFDPLLFALAPGAVLAVRRKEGLLF
jgi:hypothetical protein